MIEPSTETVPHLLQARAQATPSHVGIREKVRGVWRETSWAGYQDGVAAAALGLRSLGLEAGDRVAIHGENRAAWVFADLGTQAASGVSVGIYPTSPTEEVRYLLDHCGARFLVAEDQEQVDKALAAGRLSHLERILVIDTRGFRGYDEPRLMAWSEVMARGRELHAADPGAYPGLLDKLDPDAPATIVYTSGTTGLPKGAMSNGRNALAASRTVGRLFDPTERDEILSYLPLCHVAEKVFTYYVAMAGGTRVSFAESPETVAGNVVEVGPTIFFGVPRIWEKMQASIEIRMASASWVKRHNYRLWRKVSDTVGDRRLEHGRVPWYWRVLNRLGWLFLHRSLKRRLGLDRVRIALSGAAPISPHVLRFFSGLGVPIVEVYGMTESTGISHATRYEDLELGTVGRPIDGLEQHVGEDGELLVRGPTVFSGYVNDPDATRAAIEDGWLHTGDIAEITERGNVRITGRKKDIMITAGGKNIAPALIENSLKASPYIREAVAVGDGRRYVSALIGIELDTVADWAERQRIAFTTYRDLSERAEVIELIAGEVDRVNEQLARVEQIKAFRLIPKELDAEDAELTATQKVKRQVIHDMYDELIEGMYGAGVNA